jgi:hypothetical protein
LFETLPLPNETVISLVNRKLADLSGGEWDVARPNSLLRATISGAADIDV